MSVTVLSGYKPTRHQGPYPEEWARIRRRAVGVWMFWERGMGQAENVARPDMWSPITVGEWRDMLHGPGLYCVNQTAIDTGVSLLGNVGLYAGAAQRWTVVVRAEVKNNSEGTVLSRAGPIVANRTFHLWFNRPTTPTRTPSFVLRGGVTNTNWGLDDDQFHTFWVTWNGSQAIAYYDNAQGALTLTVGTAAEETAETIILGGRTHAIVDSYLNGALDFAAILEAELAPPAIMRWNQDLYGPWRPTIRGRVRTPLALGLPDTPAALGVSVPHPPAIPPNQMVA